jgi:hypothetical protein
MVPSGLLGPLHLPRCWSRWPAILALAPRQWSVRELGILRQRSSLQPLIDALDDDDEQVRAKARGSLEMLAQVHPDAADVVAGLPEQR